MEMLEDIIQGPIFYQVTFFALQIAMSLFEIEMVTEFMIVGVVDSVHWTLDCK